MWTFPLLHRIQEVISDSNKIVGLVFADAAGVSFQASANSLGIVLTLCALTSPIVWLTNPIIITWIKSLIKAKRQRNNTIEDDPLLSRKLPKPALIAEVLRRDWTKCLLWGIQESV